MTLNVRVNLLPSVTVTKAFPFFRPAIVITPFLRLVNQDSRMEDMNYLQFVLWDLAEVVVICLLYTLFSIKGDELGIIRLEDTSFTHIFLNAFLYCFVSLIIPYIIAGSDNASRRCFCTRENANGSMLSLSTASAIIQSAPAGIFAIKSPGL